MEKSIKIVWNHRPALDSLSGNRTHRVLVMEVTGSALCDPIPFACGRETEGGNYQERKEEKQDYNP